jgi:predicted acyltransferase
MSNPEVSYRSDALDIFRGIAILMMVFSGVIPRELLSDWMYHAQLPPPGHGFNPELVGLTWVDLVFPMFLFAMGAAMPFSLSKKLKQNDSMWKTAGQIFYRGFLLFVFAVFLQHIRPWNISSESQNLSWFLALAGFVVLMLIYTDWNRHVNLIKSRILTASGWIGAVLMMFFIPFENPAHFSLNRNDIIILILANMAVICAFLWLITRNNLRLKMVSIAIVAAIMIGGSVSGWVQDFQQNATVFWLFRWDFLYYAILVLAGTMAGEIIQAKKDQLQEKAEQISLFQMLAALVLVIVLVMGYQERWEMTPWIALAGSVLLLVNSRNNKSTVFAQMGQLAAGFLVVGALVEPWQAGIKKDPTTLSYLLITAGISFLILMILIYLFDQKRISFSRSFLIANGRNPMVAYVAFGNLLLPAMSLLSLSPYINQFLSGAALGTLRGALYTLGAGLITQFFTSKKLYWKT